MKEEEKQNFTPNNNKNLIQIAKSEKITQPRGKAEDSEQNRSNFREKELVRTNLIFGENLREGERERARGIEVK